MQPWTRVVQPRLQFHGSRGATPESLRLFLSSVWPRHEPRPRTIIIHVGTNNLGNLPARGQRAALESLWEFISCLSDDPQTEFIWSDILPKTGVRRPGDVTPQQLKTLDRVRRDVNRFARRLATRQGGRFITHPSFSLETPHLLRADGIHLSTAGFESFVHDLLIGPWPLSSGCTAQWGRWGR